MKIQQRERGFIKSRKRLEQNYIIFQIGSAFMQAATCLRKYGGREGGVIFSLNSIPNKTRIFFDGPELHSTILGQWAS